MIIIVISIINLMEGQIDKSGIIIIKERSIRQLISYTLVNRRRWYCRNTILRSLISWEGF